MELECKLAVDSHEPVRDALRTAGATRVGRVREFNRLFDRADGSLRAAGCGLRVRQVTLLEGDGPGSSVTYKGPVQKGAFKLREEIETSVADPAAMEKLLIALGFKVHVAFEKLRETWRLGGCLVELDELPQLGEFVEVEGPDDASIKLVIKQLHLEKAIHIRENYVTLVARTGEANAEGCVELRFRTPDGSPG